jgi:hypothetical protein
VGLRRHRFPGIVNAGLLPRSSRGAAGAPPPRASGG